MKRVTTLAAWRALGDDDRWLTQWRSAAPVSGHTLAGDIYWVGSVWPLTGAADFHCVSQR